MWPDHCVQGSKGAEFHPEVVVKDTDIQILKGQEKLVESYSGFGGDGEDTGLAEKLQSQGVTKVYICGLALDYCVGSTAESAAKAGFHTMVISDATKSVSKETEDLMLKRLEAAQVILVNSQNCP